MTPLEQAESVIHEITRNVSYKSQSWFYAGGRMRATGRATVLSNQPAGESRILAV